MQMNNSYLAGGSSLPSPQIRTPRPSLPSPGHDAPACFPSSLGRPWWGESQFFHLFEEDHNGQTKICVCGGGGRGAAAGYHLANFWSWQIPHSLVDIWFHWIARQVVESGFTDEEVGVESCSRSRAQGYPGSCAWSYSHLEAPLPSTAARGNGVLQETQETARGQ